MTIRFLTHANAIINMKYTLCVILFKHKQHRKHIYLFLCAYRVPQTTKWNVPDKAVAVAFGGGAVEKRNMYFWQYRYIMQMEGRPVYVSHSGRIIFIFRADRVLYLYDHAKPECYTDGTLWKAVREGILPGSASNSAYICYWLDI